MKREAVSSDDTDNNSADDNGGKRKSEVVKKNSRRLRSPTIRLLDGVTALLHDKYYEKVWPINVYVDSIVDAKCTSRVIADLKKHHPIPDLLHLKRVNGNRVILMLATDQLSASDCLNLLFGGGETTTAAAKSLSVVVGLSLKPSLVKVPHKVPLTRRQYTEASAYWPCLFREDKQIERLLSGTFFAADQLAVIASNMKTAIDTARLNQSPVGALVYDPKDERVLAVSFDGSATHPIKHAILVLIDTIAGKQGGGRWSKTNDNDDDGESKSNINQCSAIKRSIPYLLTGYDVYVTREPCISCAMALTHSRVRRVFYGCRRPITGGLGSLCKVHAIPELNHRYLVFPDVMTEECRMLTEFQRSPSGLS